MTATTIGDAEGPLLCRKVPGCWADARGLLQDYQNPLLAMCLWLLIFLIGALQAQRDEISRELL